MRNLITTVAFLLFICLGELTQAQERDSWVSVSGHVYLPGGKALAHAKIEVFPLETAVSGPLPSTISDEGGAYHLQTPSFGRTRICAKLEDLGYPDTRAKLFASDDSVFPEVRLAPGAELKNVDIQLGPANGIVEGLVVDRETQNSIRFARITMRWEEDPSTMYSTNVPQTGLFRFALPKHHITLTVAAPGFRTWNYVDPDTHARFIEVAPAEQRSIRIELERLKPSDR